jgi:hypothetical protein
LQKKEAREFIRYDFMKLARHHPASLFRASGPAVVVSISVINRASGNLFNI